MKKVIVLSYILLFSFLTASQAVPGDLPYLSTTLVNKKEIKDSHPSKTEEVTIQVLTNPEIEQDKDKENLLYTFSFHQQFIDAFKRKGWQEIHPLTPKKTMGTVELIFEPRVNLKLKETVVMKTFLYVCEDDKQWNMVKYRGGSVDKYFDKVVGKVENCVEHKIKAQ